MAEWKKQKALETERKKLAEREELERVRRLQQDETKQRRKILEMRDLQRQHQKDAEKLIKG